MKFSPINLITLRVLDYLDVKKQNNKLEKLYKQKTARKQLEVILKCFDIQNFIINPKMEEDVWLYNYISYEITSKKFPRSNLLARYETKYLKMNKKINLN